MRGRYRAFVERHEIAWELAFAALAIVFVAVSFAPIDDTLAEPIEWAITAVFAIEFTSRLWAAADRAAYLRGHWIDLAALIPPVRWLRPIRLLRLLRLVRAFAGIGRALARLERLAHHGGLIWLVVAWAAVMMLTSLGLYAAENGINKAVTNPLDALWWGLTTMTTVGYGDIYPITVEGRLAAAVLMILGIGLYSAITATIASFLIVGPGGGPLPADPLVQLRELVALREDGTISEAEFAAGKARLLARLGSDEPIGS